MTLYQAHDVISFIVMKRMMSKMLSHIYYNKNSGKTSVTYVGIKPDFIKEKCTLQNDNKVTGE